MRAGELIKNYRMERPLGAGSMGEVWLAADTRLGRAVAIKFLGTRDEEVMSRFLREAQTVALLKSEHTVKIYDADALPGGAPFLVMEYLAGDSLAELIERGPLAPPTAVDYALQVCEALAEAHAAGVVHRDIKPSNVMLTEGPGKRPQIKLVDFGIAKLASRVGNRQARMTLDGLVLGTPFYMSPEQIRASSDVDPRTDIWSLGVVLFELIVGSRPFDGGGLSVLSSVLEAPPRALPHTLVQGLREAIRRCLEKDRTDRFANVASLAHAIAPHAGDRGEAARLVERARGYLGVGFAGASTMVQARGAELAVHRSPPRLDTGATSVDEPWLAFDGAIPAQMASDRTSLFEVFSRVFERSEPVAENIVKLIGSTIAPDDQTEFFAVFMSHGSAELGAPPAIGNATFAAYVGPLRAYLEQLGTARRKVVIVIAGSGELGPGVRDTIGEYRRNLNTFVVPIWLREIQRVYVQDRSWDVIEHRLDDLHANQDPFVIDLESLDPMRCVGMGGRVNEVVGSLKDGGRVINITALPGSGKSTLVRLIQYELASRGFITIRCSERSPSPRELGREILAGIAQLAGDATVDTSEEEFSEALSSQLRAPFVPRKQLASSLAQLPRPPMLVLEDADWLIAMIASHEPSPARDEARALWAALGEVVRKHKLDMMLTSVRGHELDRTMFGGWENPTRPHTVAVALLSRRETGLLVRELAAGTASFSEHAIDQLHAATHGNVGLTLTLCSAAFRASQQRSDHNPLVPIAVTARDIEGAIERLASIDKPIGPLFNSMLSDAERHVLRAIAHAPPRSLAPIREVLVDTAAVDRAMRELQAMGMVDFERKRYRVAIPVVSAWARCHLVQTEQQAASEWRTRTRFVTVGAILSTLLFATYFVWIRNQRSDQQRMSGDGCTYRTDYPDRAEYDVPVVVYAFRSCAAPPADPAMALVPRRVAAQIDVTRGDACATQGDCMLEAHVALKVQKDGEYPFVLRAHREDVLEFAIVHDALAGLKTTLGDIFRLISFLPIALGIGLAFYRDALKAVRGWWQRDAAVVPDSRAPPAGTAS